MIEYAKRASVPVCVHLDHGETLEYLEQALTLGFTGIMYDGALLPYEKNLKNTKLAVQMAKKANAGVEAELGTMGKRESGGGEADAEDETKIYTDPAYAKAFVEDTGIDALACSFGTTHGIYLAKPRLDLGIVASVRERTGGIPVVMHGGSGVSPEDFRKAVQAGVRKINYFTYMDRSGGNATKTYIENLIENEPIFFSSLIGLARESMKDDVMGAIKTFSLMN